MQVFCACAPAPLRTFNIIEYCLFCPPNSADARALGRRAVDVPRFDNTPAFVVDKRRNLRDAEARADGAESDAESADDFDADSDEAAEDDDAARVNQVLGEDDGASSSIIPPWMNIDELRKESENAPKKKKKEKGSKKAPSS